MKEKFKYKNKNVKYLILLFGMIALFIPEFLYGNNPLSEFSPELQREIGYDTLDRDNYKEFFDSTPSEFKANVSDFRPADDSGFSVNGELFSQTRYDNLKQLAKFTKPVLLSYEFKPVLEWRRKNSVLEKISLKLGAYYQREFGQNPLLKNDFSKYDIYLDDTYLKFKFDDFDMKVGNLIETLGSGDEISFLDILNPKRLRLGLGVTNSRSKMAIPMIRTTYYFSDNVNFRFHIVPVFKKSELADNRSIWATNIQKSLLTLDPTRYTLTEEKKDNDLNSLQYHIALNTTSDNYELNFHYFRLFENMPVLNRMTPTDYSMYYPEDSLFAVNGNVKIFGEYLLRGELAYHPERVFTSFQNGIIGKSYESDEYQLLFGMDHQYSNNLYFNVQYMISDIVNFVTKTDMQQYGTEISASLRISKTFLKDIIKLEFEAVTNFTSGEYIIKPSVSYRPFDAWEMRAGYQLNDGDNYLGPISQYGRENHIFFESILRF